VFSSLPCVLCHGRHRRRLFQKEFADIVECPRCGLVSAVDAQTGAIVQTIYDRTYYHTVGTPRSGIEGYADYFGREWEERGRVNSCFARILASELPASASVLDVGCGGGQLIATLQALGFEVQGVDISSDACEKAHELHGVEVFNGTLEDFAADDDGTRRFTLVTMLDVLEHFPNPEATLKLARDFLMPRGRLFVTTPQYGGRLSQALGANYFGFRRDHAYYFTSDVLQRSLCAAGYTAAHVLEVDELEKLAPSVVNLSFQRKYHQMREHLFAFASR
jgi:2-polyprenyl-3-methyl-5-hydroxy-6-metoxy-1,4-benzoquinol methylase